MAYTVSVVTAGLPAGVSQSFDPDGTLNNQSTTTLSNATVSDQTSDFGYRGPGSIAASPTPLRSRRRRSPPN